MIVLGIDTTAAISTVCITDGNRPIALFSLFEKTEHSVALLPMIEKALDFSGKKLSDVGLICISDGPGSFTGIRIGISTVKGLAFSSGIPCIGTSSLESMAYLFADIPGYVLPLIDARRNTVYTSLFYSAGNGVIERIAKDDVLTYDEAAALIPSEGAFLTGDGRSKALSAIPKDKIKNTPEMLAYQNAYGVALCGINIYSNFSEEEKESLKGGDVLKPVYLRKSLPERIREEKNK